MTDISKTYKTIDADKFEIGMAKNNASTIMAAQQCKGTTLDDKVMTRRVMELAKELFTEGRRLRIELLGY